MLCVIFVMSNVKTKSPEERNKGGKSDDVEAISGVADLKALNLTLFEFVENV